MAGLNYTRIIIDEDRNTSLVFSHIDRCLYRCKKTCKGGTVKYLECSNENCRARGKIIDGGNFERTSAVQHSHENDHQVRADYEGAYSRLRVLAKTRLNTRLVYLHREVHGELSLEAASFLVWENVRRNLQRIRCNVLPPCHNLEELEAHLENEKGQIFELFGRLYGERFYIGSVEGQIMFGNLNFIDRLPDLVELYVDGTFGVVPFKARQLLVILAELHGKPRPIFYAIMQSQTTGDYCSIFRFATELLGVNRRVLTVTSDFEQSLRAAVRNVWPQADLVGCNFHHLQALEKNAKQSPGLAGGKLIPGTIHRQLLNMFFRVSLLPLDRLERGFAGLLDHIQELGNDDFDPTDFDEFINYFYQTWFVRFVPSSWCVSHRDRRTNNHVEGHNRKIKTYIDNNPSPWELLQGLRDLMIDASSKLARDLRINAPPPANLSLLSIPLTVALRRLNAGEIDELEFIASFSHR